MIVKKIVSGGQTGVDRAALDSAIKYDIPHGGWCPKGRRAEDGVIAACYRLNETPVSGYNCRTEWNVRDTDGTLIINIGLLAGGTLQTVKFAEKYNKPVAIIDLDKAYRPDSLSQWIRENRIETLNIAGPRESKRRGIYKEACSVLEQLFNQ